MNRHLDYTLIGLLLSSVLLYSLPFEWGGVPLRGIFVLIIVIHAVLAITNIRQFIPRQNQAKAILLFTNVIVFFHLLLIFVYLVIETNFIWLLGLIGGVLIYFFIRHYMDQFKS